MAAQLKAISDLKTHCVSALLAHEKWLFGECHGQAAFIYLEIDQTQWVEIFPNTNEAAWMLRESNQKRARTPTSESDTHYRIRDIGKDFKLNGEHISNAEQIKLSDRIEICLEFSNLTDITIHYNLVTHESSLYFIKDRINSARRK